MADPIVLARAERWLIRFGVHRPRCGCGFHSLLIDADRSLCDCGLVEIIDGLRSFYTEGPTVRLFPNDIGCGHVPGGWCVDCFTRETDAAYGAGMSRERHARKIRWAALKERVQTMKVRMTVLLYRVREVLGI